MNPVRSFTAAYVCMDCIRAFGGNIWTRTYHSPKNLCDCCGKTAKVIKSSAVTWKEVEPRYMERR